MKITNKIPKRLYKYRDFSNRTLEMIVSDTIFFADPSTFNDPLDSRPSLKTDLDVAELERILRSFFERRASAEMKAAAQTIRYRGPKTMNHIKLHSRRQADQLIAEIAYYAEDTEEDIEAYQRLLLGRYIEEELLRQYDKGIVSFAERANCPLMWSHYADQHRGVCLGYSVPAGATGDVHKVKYGGSRLVEASKVACMLCGSDVDRRQIDEAMLLRKAARWNYEREWRLLGPSGLQNSPLELEEIIFGIRCTPAAKFAVMKALEDRNRPVKFYEMREVHGTFDLKKNPLNYDDELFAFFPRRYRSVIEAFSALPRAEPCEDAKSLEQ